MYSLNRCIQRCSLSLVVRRSHPNDQGYIIVRTPHNNTIYYDNSRTNSFVNEDRHEQIDTTHTF